VSGELRMIGTIKIAAIAALAFSCLAEGEGLDPQASSRLIQI